MILNDSDIPPDVRIEFCETFTAALENWAYVEMSLFDVFSEVTLQRVNARMAAAIYSAAQHFRSKLAITDAAAQLVLDGTDFLPGWIKLAARLGRDGIKRNKIIHSLPMPVELWGSPEYILAPLPNEWKFKERLREKGWEERLKKNSLRLRQINQYARSFSVLGNETIAFSREIEGITRQPPE